MAAKPTIGEVAYRGFYRRVQGMSLDGRKLPRFEELGPTVAAAWEAAGAAVLDETIVIVGEVLRERAGR